MKTFAFLSTIFIGAATLTFAHSGVQNAAVLARMDSMKAMGDATKTFGLMAKGEAAFDPDAAKAALQDIARHSAETPALFLDQQTDPKSEALPTIWQDFADFTAKAEALDKLAQDLMTSVSTLEDVQAGLGRIAAACKACHAEYRE